VVGFNVRGRDVQSIVKKLQGKVEAKLNFCWVTTTTMAVLLKT
jgi:Cu/Ag efflux pump CusA